MVVFLQNRVPDRAQKTQYGPRMRSKAAPYQERHGWRDKAVPKAQGEAKEGEGKVFNTTAKKYPQI